MRWPILVVLLLVGLTPAAAQDDPFMEDAEGDEHAEFAGDEHDPVVDRYRHLDLRRLDWQESAEGFEFVLHVSDLAPPPGQNFQDSARYDIAFGFGGIEYVVEIYRFVLLHGDHAQFARLSEVEADDGREYRNVRAEVELRVDEAASTFSGTVPRKAVTTEDGAPATRGDVLQGFVAATRSTGIQIFGGGIGGDLDYHVRDRMPDDGAGPSYEVQLGLQQSGDASLSSEDPYRLSNGGATSLVYELHAHNGGQRQSFKLEASGVPDGWTVSLPFERLMLDEGEGETFPVLITTESGHQHGGAKNVLLTLTGERDSDDVGRAEIGIKYTDIPQPAGHHPKLWFHSFEPWGSNPFQTASNTFFGGPEAYMSTLEDDPNDVGAATPARGYNVPGLGSDYFWYIPLMPQIAMGLDFDPSEDAKLAIDIEYDYLAQDVVLHGELYYESRSGEFALATLAPTAPASWGPGAHTFEAVLDVRRDADFVPYEKEARVWLELRLEGTLLGVGPVGPGAEPRLVGGWLDLPLREYHDRTDKFYQAMAGLQFDTEYVERPVNPAETVVFQTHLRNAGTQEEEVHLNLTGVNMAWARILGDASFHLGPGKERQVAVAVEVPAGTPDGALADLILQAHSQQDPLRRAVIDIIAIVDEEADHPDESSKAGKLSTSLQDDKKSPGFEIVAVLLGLLALALLRRR